MSEISMISPSRSKALAVTASSTSSGVWAPFAPGWLAGCTVTRIPVSRSSPVASRVMRCASSAGAEMRSISPNTPPSATMRLSSTLPPRSAT